MHQHLCDEIRCCVIREQCRTVKPDGQRCQYEDERKHAEQHGHSSERRSVAHNHQANTHLRLRYRDHDNREKRRNQELVGEQASGSRQRQ